MGKYIVPLDLTMVFFVDNFGKGGKVTVFCTTFNKSLN